MSENAAHLDRVTRRIADAILQFAQRTGSADWHMDLLRQHVERQCGPVAPASPDRVLRALRKAGTVNYLVVSRRSSLYRWQPADRLF